jgi:translation initiation factor 4G
VLNKLAPENFSVLVAQVKSFNIQTPEDLEGCVKLILEKAISEPLYSAVYVQLCKEISNFFVIVGDKKIILRDRLINYCQLEFEKHKGGSMVKNRAKRLLEIETEEDEKKREELKLLFEEEDYKLRKRAVGTMKFIGELYNQVLLTNKIMRSCMNILLDDDVISELSLECLCKLLTTIGLKMEIQDEYRENLDDYTTRLNEIIEKKTPKINKRIQFMIMDVLDLKKNGWQPRRPVLVPTTHEQISLEIQKELKPKEVNRNTKSGKKNKKPKSFKKKHDAESSGPADPKISWRNTNKALNCRIENKKIEIKTESTSQEENSEESIVDSFVVLSPQKQDLEDDKALKLEIDILGCSVQEFVGNSTTDQGIRKNLNSAF